jgi:hypothetical protein
MEARARMNETGIRSRAEDASNHPIHFIRASVGGQHRESGKYKKEEKTLGCEQVVSGQAVTFRSGPKGKSVFLS